MIVNSSTDPVLVKKIDLHIWTLRDEIEASIKKRYEEGGENSSPDISDIRAEYTGAKKESQAPEIADLMASVDAPPVTEGDSPVTEITEATAEHTDPNKILIAQKLPVISAEKLGLGVSLLSEINMEAIYFFATRKFLPGQSVMIEFRVPKHFVMSADIVFCRSFNLKSRIISASKMPYRIGAKFTFAKTGERTLLRQFVTSIEPNVGKKGGAAKEADAGDDELAALLNS